MSQYTPVFWGGRMSRLQPFTQPLAHRIAQTQDHVLRSSMSQILFLNKRLSKNLKEPLRVEAPFKYPLGPPPHTSPLCPLRKNRTTSSGVGTVF